ncbi:MAG TPA: hypothetical protein VMV83_08615 [Rectinemataceae bacterium]|nr:hypothetical protein [Rectinemataceae bacterium]
MTTRSRRVLGIACFLCACASIFAAPKSVSKATASQSNIISLSLEAAGFGGGTIMAGRPLLPRTGYAISSLLALGDAKWTWIALGLDGFALGESMPDASLFLYRGYGGNSLFLGTGPRFELSRLGWKPLAKSRLDLVGGAGIAATEDTGTTLVSLLPFLRLDSRVVTTFNSDWSWSVGLPIEVQRRATATTWLGGLSLAIVWTPKGEGGK